MLLDDKREDFDFEIYWNDGKERVEFAPSMEVSVCSLACVWPCPFRGFLCCPDGMAGSKGFPRRACHHTDGMTRFKWAAGDVKEFIVGIVRPQVRREVVPLGRVVVDEVLLDRVFSVPITTVKSISHSCRMAFSHALAALGKDDRVSGSDSSTVGTNVKQCLRKVSDGHFTAAVKVLCSSGVAPFGTDTLTALLAKHLILPLPEMSKYLGDFQFGVGVPSGAEAVLHGMNRFLNKFHSDGSLAMLIVDFSNAFNLVDRTTLLYEGDPLWPLLFALVLYPLVHRIKDCCQLLFHAWYLDDGTIIRDTKEVAKAIDIIRAEGPRLGLELNIKKTKVFWPSYNGVKVKDGLFPSDIGRPTLGVKLLGDAEGDRGYCRLWGSFLGISNGGQAALKAESSKVAKHEKACLENQHMFIPYAFDTFGFLAPEAEEFLTRVQRVVQTNFLIPKTQNFIFSRIGFAIQKEVAAQFVARLSVIL
nr:hypothetical protein [Tanacetum cinerariifolium]